MLAQGREGVQQLKLCKSDKKVSTNWRNKKEKTNVFKIEYCGSYGQLQQKTKVCRFLSKI
jgi:hypothetical protein